MWDINNGIQLSQSKSESVALSIPAAQVPVGRFSNIRCVPLNSFVSQSKLWYSYVIAAISPPSATGTAIWTKKILYNETDDVFDFSHTTNYVTTSQAVPGFADYGNIVNLEPNAVAFGGVGVSTLDDPGWILTANLNDPDFPPVPPVEPSRPWLMIKVK